MGPRGLLFVSLALLSLATDVGALSPSASLSDLQRWFAATQRSHEVDLGLPQRWVYSFTAPDTRALEALSAELVRREYRIAGLAGGERATLRVTKVELHSPSTLVQQNAMLHDLARRHGARYASFELAPAD